MARDGWGPFGLGKWRGHAGVYCGVCGWPVWSAWVDDSPPPGTCVEGKTHARGCSEVIDKLMLDAFVRAATGNPMRPEKEMLRACTGLSWPEIEAMCDASGKASHKISEMLPRSPALPSMKGMNEMAHAMQKKISEILSFHRSLDELHPKLSRGQVWCKSCGQTMKVNSGDCMAHGWPKCCGETMTIDSPEERATP